MREHPKDFGAGELTDGTSKSVAAAVRIQDFHWKFTKLDQQALGDHRAH